MNIVKNSSGFTLLEILVALGIMAIGFLAMAQMQFLSLRQAGLAEVGTTATNIIDLAANRDLQELRRMHLLNSIAYNDAVKGNTTDFSYCSGTDATCDECPCDGPAEVLNIEVGDLTTVNNDTLADGIAIPNPLLSTVCSQIEITDFDPADIDYSTEINDCTGTEFILFRAVEGFRVNGVTQSDPDNLTYRISYGIKTPREVGRDNRQEVSNFNINIGRTVASQTFTITAHIENDWDRYIAAWNQVIIPHIP